MPPLKHSTLAAIDSADVILFVVDTRDGILPLDEEVAKRLRPHCDTLIVCTDDGSYGRPGFVTVALDEVCRDDRPDQVIAVGPLPMMSACSKVTERHGVPTIVSLNAIMVDGTGMCGGCRVTVGGQTKYACVDGPEFDAHKVNFQELADRLTTYRSFEQAALERQKDQEAKGACATTEVKA